jgi:hypothetical protein
MEFVFNKLSKAKERKLDGATEKVGSLCVHVHIPSACQGLLLGLRFHRLHSIE